MNSDTDAGQLFDSTPNGSKIGVIALPIAESKLFSESPLPAVNSVSVLILDSSITTPSGSGTSFSSCTMA